MSLLSGESTSAKICTSNKCLGKTWIRWKMLSALFAKCPFKGTNINQPQPQFSNFVFLK